MRQFYLDSETEQTMIFITPGLSQMISESADNSYSSPDGLVNFDKLETLNKQVKEKVGDTAAGFFVVSRKAKCVQYSAGAERRGDLTYMKRRAPKVAERKRVKPESLARVKILLTVPNKDDVSPALWQKVQQAVKALKAHARKAESQIERVQKAKAKVRTAENKIFNESLKQISQVLAAGGIKQNQVATAETPFGTQMLVNLGGDNVVAITKADPTKFRAARRANQDTA